MYFDSIKGVLIGCLLAASALVEAAPTQEMMIEMKFEPKKAYADPINELGVDVIVSLRGFETVYYTQV